MGRTPGAKNRTPREIETAASMGEQEYSEKCTSLGSSDMSEVAAAIGGMEAESLGDDDED